MGATVRKISEARVDALETLGEEAPSLPGKPGAVVDLYRAFTEDGLTLADLAFEHQRAFEAHSWSVVKALEAVDLSRVTERDRMLVWNAGRAELTAKPSADRISRIADRDCRRLQGKNDVVASIVQGFGTWTRHWSAEEARHETSFNRLSKLLGFHPVDDATVMEYRKVFPDDDLLRTATLLSFSEAIAAVNYGQFARHIREPGLRALFKRVGADEVHHLNYFISFARAMVDSGEYASKEAFAVAHLFLREGGELYGIKREHLEKRDTHVNWWDRVEFSEQMNAPEALERKQALILYALRRITGIACSSAQDVEDTWMDLVGS